MGVRHAKVSGKAAPADSTEVGGPDWDAVHLSPPFVVTLLAQHGAVAFTNIPAALTEWNGANRTRTKLDLTSSREARVTAAVTTAANAAAEIRIQYATDGDAQATWAYLDGGSGPLVNIGAVGGRASGWVALAATAKADVWIRVVSINGDGAADPIVGLITLQLR